MKIDKDVITRVSGLARLELTEEEKTEFSRQLSDIISYVEKINELNTENVEPADHIADLTNVFREDSVKESIDREKIENITPEFDKGFIVVPKIIEGS
jgi:aspartyl-tRNA(Asn)/glutamyl-tRNA(Gln) amidotransferase subunit C